MFDGKFDTRFVIIYLTCIQ